MPILFGGASGRVVRFEDPAIQCAMQLYRIAADGPGGAGPAIEYQTQNAIVTRLTLSSQVNVQFLHTIGAHIYIYVFGDRIGQLRLSGLGFTCGCDQPAPGGELMYSWYKQNRSSSRQAPVQVVLGTTPIEGFVLDFTEDVVDPSTGLVQWGISMATLPDDRAGRRS